MTSAWLAVCLSACTVPVAGELDDGEANRVFVVLDRAGIDPTKEPDPNSEGKWRVDVSRDEVPRALSALRDEQLPRRASPGVLEAIGKGSLVPSEAAEHAQLAAGLAGDLERSLEGIDGILRARVHLSVPTPNPLLDNVTAVHPTAGVLIEHRGATPPLSADSVQHFVAGGVAGMLPADVSVVMVARTSPVALGGDGIAHLSHVGPIAVARASVRNLEAALAVLMAALVLLSGATLILYTRLHRAREALAQEEAGRASP